MTIEILRLLMRSGGKPLVLMGQALGILPPGAPGGFGVVRKVLGSHQAKLISVWLAGKLENLSREDKLKLLAAAGVKLTAASALLLKRGKARLAATPGQAGEATTDEADAPDSSGSKMRELIDTWKAALADQAAGKKGRVSGVLDRFKK